MTGFDDVTEKVNRELGVKLPPFIQMKSGRIIDSTASWNPFVFAFVYDHIEVLKYLIDKRHCFNLRLCFQVDEIYSLKDDHTDHGGQLMPIDDL